MSLDKFVIKYLTLKRLILLIVIAIYTCNYERTSKPALFFKKDIDYGGDNLAIDPSMIKHYNLQKESIELRKINNELVRQIKTRQKVLLTLSTTTNVSSLLPNSKKITVKESEIDKNIIKDNIFDAMNKATNNMQNRNSNLLKVYFGGKSFSWNEARGKFSGNFGILNKKNRRPSYPFLSGDGFRAICKHRCEDKGCSFNPRDVANGDCVYLASTDLKSFKTTVKYIESFFRTMFPKIDKNVIIIVHNGDLSTPEGDNWHKNERGGESVSRNVWEKSFTIYLNYK